VAQDLSCDVFISYAHSDNEYPDNASTSSGWVTSLARNLNIGPNVRKKNLFIDHQLKPGDDFSDDLIAKVEHSKLLVLLLSQNYIDSRWCGKELEHFIHAHANDAEKPADVFVVELFPYDELSGTPANIDRIRKRLIHAKFWHQPADASSPILSGYPTPRESGAKGEIHYWNELNKLRNAIDTRLRLQPKTPPAPQGRACHGELPGSEAAGRPAAPHLATILLADVTEDLEAERNAVKTELEPEGIKVLPDGDYVGLTPQEFEAVITADLKSSQLFVQLLSPTVGRKSKGYAAPLPQLQFKVAVAARLPIMQWCEHLPEPGRIADPAHARLFETEFLRATNLARFKAEVIGRLRMEKEKQEKALARSATVLPISGLGKKVVFIDDFASNPELNKRVRTIIKQENCDIRSLPPASPYDNSSINITELLRPCRAGMTIYTDCKKYESAYNRLVFFLNQVAAAHLGLSRWGVYLHEGDVSSLFGIESDDVVPVYEQDLVDFIRGL
jgi:hypothetical protein